MTHRHDQHKATRPRQTPVNRRRGGEAAAAASLHAMPAADLAAGVVAGSREIHDATPRPMPDAPCGDTGKRQRAQPPPPPPQGGARVGTRRTLARGGQLDSPACQPRASEEGPGERRLARARARRSASCCDSDDAHVSTSLGCRPCPHPGCPLRPSYTVLHADPQRKVPW